MTTLRRFLSDESGLETVEYAIITGLIVAAALTALGAIGVWVAGVYTDLQNTVGA